AGTHGGGEDPTAGKGQWRGCRTTAGRPAGRGRRFPGQRLASAWERSPRRRGSSGEHRRKLLSLVSSSVFSVLSVPLCFFLPNILARIKRLRCRSAPRRSGEVPRRIGE